MGSLMCDGIRRGEVAILNPYRLCVMCDGIVYV